MKQILYSFLLFSFILSLVSCKDNPEDPPTTMRSPDEPHPDSTCHYINNCLITYGFEYEDVKTLIFRTYKKGSDFKEFIKEYKVSIDRDYLLQQKPDSYENKRKERNVTIPAEINADVDFKIITTDSTEFKITEIDSDWRQFYGNYYLGWSCDMKSFKVNGKQGTGNIYIARPGYPR